MRRSLATILSLFATGVFLYTAYFVYDAYYGVPEGLAGGRTAVALPGSNHLRARGGMIRGVYGMDLDLRALAPNSTWEFENSSAESATFNIALINVKPSALRLQAVDSESGEEPDSVPFEPGGPNTVRFSLTIPPGSLQVLQAEQSPQTDGQIRFYVFGHARNGLLFLRRMESIVKSEQPDFVIGLGDNYYRAFPDKILEFERQLNRMEAPTFLMPGEIEYREQNEPSPADNHPLAAYHKLDRHAAIFGRGDQVFDYQGWRFVMVENGRDRNVGSLRWLKSLAPLDSESPRTLLFSHIPPYDPREIDGKNVTTGAPKEHAVMKEQILRLNAAAAFFDHYRWFEARKVDGVPTYVTSISMTQRARGQYPHFLEVRLENGEVNVLRRFFTSDPPEDVTLAGPGAPSPAPPQAPEEPS